MYTVAARYEMIAIIANPKTPEGMTSDIVMKMSCTFSHDPKQYGNGYVLHIETENGFEKIIDLRYDTDFNRFDKEEYLREWAETYWNGNDGAYILKSLSVTGEEF